MENNNGNYHSAQRLNPGPQILKAVPLPDLNHPGHGVLRRALDGEFFDLGFRVTVHHSVMKVSDFGFSAC